MDITCEKCKTGFVITDLFIQDNQWLPGYRCINCGWMKIDETKVKHHANKETARRPNKLDELELYRTRSRNTQRSSHSIQH